MHQRRAGPSAPALPPGADVITSPGTPPSSTSGPIKRRKKASGRKTTSPSRFTLQLRQVFQDEDMLITLIQAVSILVLVGCGVALMLHYFGSSREFQNGDNSRRHDFVPVGTPNGDSSSSRQSWLSSLFHFLSWTVTPNGMALRSLRRQRLSNGLYPRMDMTPSRVYEIPGSLSFVGDKSDHYAALRKEFDAKLAGLPEIEQKYTFGVMLMNDQPSPNLAEPYDVYNCPDDPPTNYPYDWNLLKILDHWEPDDPKLPEDYRLFQGLCMFDYNKDYDKALNYRRKELPFVVINDPQVKETVKRWNAPGYMEKMLGTVRHRAEFSESNHFLYWNKPAGQRKGSRPGMGRNVRRIQQKPDLNPLLAPEAQNLKGWKEPTTMMRMTYQDWLSHANLTATGDVVGPNDPHYYFRLIGCGETGPQGECDMGSSEYLFDELPYFQPRETLYVVDPMEQKGIHCRFGMHGVIAENHFDQSRNAIVVLGGERRYILAHPNQCKLLSLLPKGHPSARHSAVDWSDPDLVSYPEFAKARGNEVVLQPGDVLYLPTNWFHYIISLNLNFQCNTRSGVTPEYMRPIRECGF